MSARLCVRDDCDRKHKGHGLCELHLYQSRQSIITCKHCGCTYKSKKGQRKSYCYDCVPVEHYKIAINLMKEYNLAWPEWQAMYFEQDGKCAIPTCDREARVVDHNHDTGKVRALLCHGCNSGLGHLENSAWVQAAYEYLKEFSNY